MSLPEGALDQLQRGDCVHDRPKKRQPTQKTGTSGTICFNGMIGFDNALPVSISL